MATFIAATPVDMDTLIDLSILTQFSTTWTSDITTFSATSAGNSVTIEGSGAGFNLINPVFTEQTGGTVASLTVTNGALHPHTAYSITGVNWDFLTLVGNTSFFGPFGTLGSILSGNDIVTGSAGADIL